MQQRKTLTLRLSAAVLAGVLLCGGAAPAMAAATAVSTQVTSAEQRAQAYEAIKRLAGAESVADVKQIAASDDLGAVPALKQVAEKLSSLPADTPLAASSRAHLDSVVDTRELVFKAALHTTDPQRAATEPAAACPTVDLDRYIKTLLPQVDQSGTPEEIQEDFNQLFALLTLTLMGGIDAPAYEALFEGPTRQLSTFGEEQNKTKVITKSFKDVQKFWAGDVDPGRITLGAMKDDLVTSRGTIPERGYAAYALASQDTVGDFDPRKVLETTDPKKLQILDEYGQTLHSLIDGVPVLDDGESPLFTLNAYAFSPTPGSSVEASLPKRLVFGDGMLQFLRAAKYNDSSIESVIGHEFGHHIQYVNGFDQPDGTAAEKTRHSELEADAYGNYYVSHKKGANFTPAEEALSAKLAFNIGDCNVTEESHHGTPAQRQAAALWAQNLANSQQKNGHVFSADSIRIKFNKALPELLAAK